MSGHQQRVGHIGETLALEHLQRQGYMLLARNWRTPLGELDLVMVAPDGTRVFVEVKTRFAPDVDPLESITARKQRILINAAQVYLHRQGASDLPWRFDVIAVTLSSPPRIDHYQDAFTW